MTDKQITSPKHPEIELFVVLIGLLATLMIAIGVLVYFFGEPDRLRS